MNMIKFDLNRSFKSFSTDKEKIVLKKIRQYANSGETQEEIAKKCGICVPTLLKYAKSNGINIVTKGDVIHGRIMDIPYDELILSTREGCKISHLAQKYQVSCDTIQRILTKLKIQTKFQKMKSGVYDEEIIKLHNLGLSKATIADKLGIGDRTITGRMSKLNLIPMSQNIDNIRQLSDNEICHLYNMGYSIEAIGIKFNVSSGPILSILKKNGVEIRPSTKSNKPKIHISNTQIINAVKEGKSSETIAKNTGLSEAAILKILKNWGIKTKEQTEYQNLEKIPDLKIFEMAKSGKTPNVIGMIIGLNPEIVRHKLNRWGVLSQLQSSSIKVRQIDNNELKTLYKKYKSTRKLADIYKVSYVTILRKLKKLGVEISKVGFQPDK